MLDGTHCVDVLIYEFFIGLKFHDGKRDKITEIKTFSNSTRQLSNKFSQQSSSLSSSFPNIPCQQKSQSFFSKLVKDFPMNYPSLLSLEGVAIATQDECLMQSHVKILSSSVRAIFLSRRSMNEKFFYARTEMLFTFRLRRGLCDVSIGSVLIAHKFRHKRSKANKETKLSCPNRFLLVEHRRRCSKWFACLWLVWSVRRCKQKAKTTSMEINKLAR